jgi:hypothetical protein
MGSLVPVVESTRMTVGQDGKALGGRRNVNTETLMPLVLLFLTFGMAGTGRPDQVPVRYAEGLSHGFLILRTQEGVQIADGDDTQVVKDDVVTNHLTFRFKDGSLYEDTTTFTQRGVFRLLTDHVVQKGPTFPAQMESWIDMSSGRVAVHSVKDGKLKEIDQKLDLPPDLGNGMLFTIVKSMLPHSSTVVSYLGFSPQPRIVKLVFTHEGDEVLTTDRSPHKTLRFLMKVEIGGIAGIAASITKKQPADTRIWVITGEAPTFAGSEGPLYGEGPVWQLDLASPRRKKN